jgi:SPP1 gp7 family putative phage head morphogenesis protein
MSDNFQPPRSIESRYAHAMHLLINKVFGDFDFMDPLGYLTRINEFVASDIFRSVALGMASRMVTSLQAHNARSWCEAASEGTRGREIYAALKQSLNGPVGDMVRRQIDWNAGLISSAPLDVSRWITSYVMEQQQCGRRAADIAVDLRERLPGLTRSRVNLIARTEVSKASTALTQAQSQDIGLNYFIWRTSKDGRVRESHRNLDGVLMSWNDLPHPELLVGEKDAGKYGPGEIYNCRCIASPVIDLKYINWPIRVFMNGRISRMRRSEFERVAA